MVSYSRAYACHDKLCARARQQVALPSAPCDLCQPAHLPLSFVLHLILLHTVLGFVLHMSMP